MSTQIQLRSIQLPPISSPLLDLSNRSNLVRQRQINIPEQVQRKKGMGLFKALSHPQQWRVETITGTRNKIEGDFATLGPMGALGDDVICEIILNYSLLQTFVTGIANIKEETIIRVMKNVLFQPVATYLHTKIDILAPLKSQALRKSLHNAVNNSMMKGAPYRLVLNTDGVDYASVVNKMPTSSLIKSGMAPGAKKGWYNLLLLEGRNKSKTSFTAMVKSIASLFPAGMAKRYFNRTSYNLARSLFQFSKR